MADEPGVEFAVAAAREEGRWEVTPLPARSAGDLTELVEWLRRQPSESGTIALVAHEDDYFVAIRVLGEEVRLLLSDVTAAEESPLARDVLDALDLPLPEGDDADRVQPAGDLGIFADFGFSAMELGALCDDLDLYPDEALADIAGRLGFAEQFESAVESTAGSR